MKNVSKKLLMAINEVGGKVQKTGWNSYSKYHYITESDINEAVLPALTKVGLVLTTSVESVKETPSSETQKNRFAEVILVHKIIDTDSGEVLEFKSAGTGADTLDKSVYKALTGACKYFMMKLFMISGDSSDPENDGSEAPAKAPPAAAKQENKFAPKGFMAKKAEQAAAPATPPATTGAKKPSFGAKKPAESVEAPAESEEATTEASEEDAPY